MNHPDEERLVLYLLGDDDDRRTVEPHIEECAGCRAEVERLETLLRVATPADPATPDDGFEDRIWRRQRAVLAAEGRLATAPAPGAEVVPFWSWRRMGAVAAVAASLIVAFMLGLYTPPPGSPPAGEAAGADRVLMIAVGAHLERAGMVLLEVSNASTFDDIAVQRTQAQKLIANNRLFRQSAQLEGQAALAELLDEVERVLLDLARSETDDPAELEWFQQRIAARDLLFKVKVVEGSARRDTAYGRSPGRSL